MTGARTGSSGDAMEIPGDLRVALDEGLTSSGGEIVIRSAEGVSRIYVHQGCVAWVTAASVAVRLTDRLIASGSVSRDLLQEVVRSCQVRRTNFAETLVEWGLIDRVALREHLRLHNALHLRAVLQASSPRVALFLPQPRVYLGEFLFEVEELLAVLPPGSTPSPLAGTTRDGRVPAIGRWASEQRSGLSGCRAVIVAAPGIVLGDSVEPSLEGHVVELIARLTTLIHDSPVTHLLEGFGERAPPDASVISQMVHAGDDGVLLLTRSDSAGEHVIVALFEAEAAIEPLLAECRHLAAAFASLMAPRPA